MTRKPLVFRRTVAPWVWIIVSLIRLGGTGRVFACDLCAIYIATEQRESRTGFRAGFAEQFTSSTSILRDGREIDNPAGQRLDSSITQFLFGYNFVPRAGMQLNVPLIARTFRRVEGMTLANGDETGIGDLSLTANLVAYTHTTENSLARLSLLGGLKLPTGSPRRLREELSESHSAHDVSDMPSVVHGHDLALGSGSTDGIVGTQLFWSWKRLYCSGAVQYLLRTEGSYEYEYANDLMWTAGPGAFALLGHGYSLGVQGAVSGESKGKDQLGGTKQDDTAITTLFIGPNLLFTWGMTMGADFAVEIPFVQNSSALQLVRDYRLRGGLTWRF